MVGEFQRVYKAKDENLNYEKELTAQLAKLQKTRQKYMDMYADDLISREELNDKIGGMRKEIERLENELKMVSYHLTKGEQLESVLGQTFKEIEDITDVRQMTNAQLKRIIQKIEVDKDGNVDIYLRLLGDLGLDETVLIRNDETFRFDCDRSCFFLNFRQTICTRYYGINHGAVACFVPFLNPFYFFLFIIRHRS